MQYAYALGVFNPGASERDPLLVDGLIDLDEATWAKYVEAAGALTALQQRELFPLLATNHTELEDRQSFIREVIGAPGETGRLDQRAARVQLNQLLINWLTSMRLYLDHTETRLSRSFGKNSSELAAFKKATNEAFDNSVGYRFMYKLRNYTQHCGLPVSGFDLTERRPGSPMHWTHEVTFYLDRTLLLSAFDEWGQVRRDLELMPPKIEVLPYVVQAMKRLDRIEECVLRLEIDHALGFWPTVSEALDLLGDVDGAPTLFRFTEVDGVPRKIQMHGLPSNRVLIGALLTADDPIDVVRALGDERQRPTAGLITAQRAHADRRGAEAIAKWVAEEARPSHSSHLSTRRSKPTRTCSRCWWVLLTPR